MRLCMCIMRQKCWGGVFEPVEPPVEKPETPTTPPSTEDLLTIKINDEIMAVVGTNTWNAIAYGNGKYVAVGTNNYATTSTDGVNWTTPANVKGGSTISKSPWNDIIFVDGIFVTVGDEPYVYTSEDGVLWERKGYTHTSSTYESACILYHNGVFFVAGYTNLVSSTDLLKWNQCSAYPTCGWKSIKAVNDKIIVVGDHILVSTDNGVSWTKSSFTVKPYMLYDIAYNNNIYVAIGTNAIITSCDGITWGDYVVQDNQVTFNRIVFVNGCFIVTDTSGGFRSSLDGITWSDSVKLKDESGNFVGSILDILVIS